ncbi:hypothetical protein JXB02_00545 [Candidatus Woesearchaeota archaeon]|nr:hypothetical protein [Candidatus Woesearchaeota archaeon]
MISEQDKKKLATDLDKRKETISEVKEKLTELGEQKEDLFKRKEEISQEIRQLIGIVRNLKRERNQLTDQVKSHKVKRKEIIDSIKRLIAEVNAYKREKDAIAAKSAHGKNPLYLKKDIERLESRIETDVMSFEREQKLMKQIKEMKKQFEESRELTEAMEKVRSTSREIERLKREADQIHATIQELAHASQEKHEEMLTHSKRIDELKAKEDEAYKQFFEQKKRFSAANEVLKEQLSGVRQINEKLSEAKTETRKARREKEEKKLQDMGFEVDRKIKERRKLTTKDLLVFQKTAINEPEAADLPFREEIKEAAFAKVKTVKAAAPAEKATKKAAPETASPSPDVEVADAAPEEADGSDE